MSIIIKGIEMPKEEPITIQILPSGAVYLEDKLVYEACAVEIPTPHGRLIDADAVNKAMDERIEKLKDDKSIYEASCVSTALDMFAPTVIEAEGET